MSCEECGWGIGMPGWDAYVVLTEDDEERCLCAECHDAQLRLSPEPGDGRETE